MAKGLIYGSAGSLAIGFLLLLVVLIVLEQVVVGGIGSAVLVLSIAAGLVFAKDPVQPGTVLRGYFDSLRHLFTGDRN